MTSGLFAISAVVAVYDRPEVTSRLGWDSSNLIIGTVLAVFLVGASFLAILRKKNGHLLMLVAAAIFFGELIYQNADLIGHADALMPNGGEGKVVTNIVRSGLQLTLTAWAVLSSKTRRYFNFQSTVAGA